MKKRILALLMAAAMMFALAACGNQSNDTSDPPSDNSQAVEPDDSATPGGDTEPTKTGTLKIGLLVHQTGWFAGVDTPNYNEFHAMIDYINDDLGGWTVGDTTYTLEPVAVDGQSDDTAVTSAALSLVDAGVDFVVETNDFWVASCADIFEEEGIMHTSAYCVLAPGYITPEHTMAFTGSNGTGGDYATAFAALNKYYPDVKSVILANDDNGLKEEMLGLMQKYAEPYGIEVKGMVIYPGTTTDYTPYAQQLVLPGMSHAAHMRSTAGSVNPLPLRGRKRRMREDF